MNRNLIINELKLNLQKVSQVISLIENFNSTNASVELDLMQKNITILFENYVKLKMSYEVILTLDDTALSLKSNPVALLKEEDVIVPPTPLTAKEEAPIKKSSGFSFSLADDEGEMKRNIESKDDKNEKSDSDLLHSNNGPINIAFDQSNKSNAEAPVINFRENTEKDISLNDHFSTLNKDVNLANKHLNTPIADLSREISLNKKFAFVNELFSGNMDHYTNAIQQLNTVGSAEYAKKYINELKATLRWDKESNTVAEFVDLVERRWMR